GRACPTRPRPRPPGAPPPARWWTAAARRASSTVWPRSSRGTPTRGRSEVGCMPETTPLAGVTRDGGGGQGSHLGPVLADDGRGHRVLDCLACGFAHFWPRPSADDLAAYYARG